MRYFSSLLALGLVGAAPGCGDSNTSVGGTGPTGESQASAEGDSAGAGSTGTGGSSVSSSGFPGGTVNGSVNGVGGNGAVGGSVGVPSECQPKYIDAYADAPDVMIVLDRSSSMVGGGLGGNRWGPTVSAINSIASDFDDLIAFGLTVFPGTQQATGGGGPNPLAIGLGITDIVLTSIFDVGSLGDTLLQGVGIECIPGDVLLPPTTGNAAQLASTIQSQEPRGAVALTPTATGLVAALGALGDRNPGPDSIRTPAYVLLVTDGQPSCSVGVTTATDVDNSVTAISALAAAGIPTYVLGYDIASAPASVDLQSGTTFVPTEVMNQFAQAGGTERYYEVGDGTFESTMREIAASTVTCTFDLASPPKDPTFLLVTIDNQQINLNDPNLQGWVIEGNTVTLQDGACARIKDGIRHTIAARDVCAVVVPI